MKQTIAPRVLNRNRDGDLFDPCSYIVHRNDNPELFKFLEAVKNDNNKRNAGEPAAAEPVCA